jgi:hypothetical protein
MEMDTMPGSEDVRQFRRLLAGIVALLVLLNVLVVVGLYFHFVPRPVDKLLSVLPILATAGLVMIVLAVGTGFVKLLVAAREEEHAARPGLGIPVGDRTRAH